MPEAADVVSERPELLLVEDDEALSSLLAMSLVDQFKVRRVDTISDAFAALSTMKPSAILLDMHLPDGTGFEMLEQLRKSAETQDIPVVVMSGSEPAVGKFNQPVVVDYLKKPFKEADLLLSLGRALKYRPKRHARALIAEDDEATQQVLKDQLERIGVDCQIAASGEKAVELLFTEKFDLLVLDLGLPDVSGTAVIDLLKKEGMGDIPLLVYTAQAPERRRSTQVDSGRDKAPHKIDRNRRRICRCSTRTAQGSGTPRTIGQLELTHYSLKPVRGLA